MKKLSLLLFILPLQNTITAQSTNCTFRQPRITIHFGTGNAEDLSQRSLDNYERVSSYCPTDGHYTYTSYTSGCFRNDWYTLTEDHTPGDVNGYMMIVNASYSPGDFFVKTVDGLCPNTTYEFAAWIMTVAVIRTRVGMEVYGTNTELEGLKLGPCVAGDIRDVSFAFQCDLCPQEYTVTAASHDPDGVWHDWLEDAVAFRVTDTRYTAGVANLRAKVLVTTSAR